MRIEKISYHKTFNLGNYSNEKIGVDIILAEGDNALDAFAEAKVQVEKSHKFFKEAPAYEQAKNIKANPLDYTGNEVLRAEQTITAFEANYPDFLATFQPASRQLTEPDRNDEYDGSDLDF